MNASIVVAICATVIAVLPLAGCLILWLWS